MIWVALKYHLAIQSVLVPQVISKTAFHFIVFLCLCSYSILDLGVTTCMHNALVLFY